jgi:predicted MFS family arabinose efflux permease
MTDSTEVPRRATYTLFVLFAINAMNFFDRVIGGAVAEPIRKEWQLSDSALGALGTAFTLLYAFAGVPLGRLADRYSRKSLLAGGVAVWSALTALSGVARTFWSLFVMRLGVGVGEAVCAPAATSLIGDLYPPARRSRAMSLFMMGLPIGIALSFFLGGSIAQSYGWRAAFFVAGAPGLLCAIAAMFIREPARDGGRVAEPIAHPYRSVLSVPTMWWIIISGALHNFNMYALGSFIAPFVIRYHGVDLRQAGLISMTVYGLSGIPGLLAGGVLADSIGRTRKDGRLLLGSVCIFISVPLMVLALMQPPRAIAAFVVLATLACMVMYVYYSTVYAAIQDVVEPRLRGTAMALYFLAMYVLGASLGPLGTGMASDFFTRRAAAAAGAVVLEPFKGAGLHNAMYLIPLLSIILTFVLFAASRTIVRDARHQ